MFDYPAKTSMMIAVVIGKQSESNKTEHPPQGIATQAYGPLTSITKAANGPVDDILQSLARKYAVSPGEICLRWCIDQDVIPITTSGKEQRLSDYLRALTFKLTPKEISQVSREL